MFWQEPARIVVFPWFSGVLPGIFKRWLRLDGDPSSEVTPEAKKAVMARRGAVENPYVKPGGAKKK